jgi:hypothetical protein
MWNPIHLPSQLKHSSLTYSEPIFIKFSHKIHFCTELHIDKGCRKDGRNLIYALMYIQYPPTFQSTDWHEIHSLKKSSEQTTEEWLLTNQSADQYSLSGDDK